jgi:hypothetical protein
MIREFYYSIGVSEVDQRLSRRDFCGRTSDGIGIWDEIFQHLKTQLTHCRIYALQKIYWLNAPIRQMQNRAKTIQICHQVPHVF